jgi:hypothetical protein
MQPKRKYPQILPSELTNEEISTRIREIDSNVEALIRADNTKPLTAWMKNST